MLDSAEAPQFELLQAALDAAATLGTESLDAKAAKVPELRLRCGCSGKDVRRY